MGPFRVDLAQGRLLKDGIAKDLRPQAFRALKVLIQSQGRMVDYDQMIREAWNVHVSKHTVATTINEIKNVLGEYASWITCRPKIGYRLEVPKSDDLMRRGWHFWNQYTKLGFENALCCFHEAAENNPSDFRPFEAIASTYLMQAGFLMRAPAELHEPFVWANQRAVALCGETETLRVDRAFGLCLFERRIKEAEAELTALQPEHPNSVHICVRLALIHLASGNVESARSLITQARKNDALAPELAFLEIVVLLFVRHFEAAVECGRRMLGLHPGSQVLRAFYAEALDFAGYPTEAIAEYKVASSISSGAARVRADQGRCLARHGYTNAANKILEELRANRSADYVDAVHLAMLLEALDRRDEAFAELERAYDENSYSLLFAKLDPKADVFRSDPRFERLESRVMQEVPA